MPGLHFWRAGELPKLLFHAFGVAAPAATQARVQMKGSFDKR